MPTRSNLRDVELDHIHSEAVWQGIGERLRDTIAREQAEMSPQLRSLMARLAELDRETVPPLVPAM